MLASEIRNLNIKLKSIQIRQAARKAFDLTQFGTGNFERMLSAMVFAALFVPPLLIAAAVWELRADYMIAILVASAVTVLSTCAALVMWSSDESLADEFVQVKSQLADLLPKLLAEKEQRKQQQIQQRGQSANVANVKSGEVVISKKAVVVTTSRCPFCREIISVNAIKCKHCGELFDDSIRRARSYNPGVAAVLSFFWPGLGQIYKRKVLSGLLWLFVVVVGYVMCFVPGLFLHVICIFDAASGGE